MYVRVGMRNRTLTSHGIHSANYPRSLLGILYSCPLSGRLLVCSFIIGQLPLLATFEIDVLFPWGMTTFEPLRYLGNITHSLPYGTLPNYF